MKWLAKLKKTSYQMAAAVTILASVSVAPTASGQQLIQAFYFWDLWICAGSCAGPYCCVVTIIAV